MFLFKINSTNLATATKQCMVCSARARIKLPLLSNAYYNYAQHTDDSSTDHRSIVPRMAFEESPFSAGAKEFVFTEVPGNPSAFARSLSRFSLFLFWLA